jgi:hypothetical protein
MLRETGRVDPVVTCTPLWCCDAGRDGSCIRAISKQASEELQKLLGRRVNLTLHVSVKPKAAVFRNARLRDT